MLQIQSFMGLFVFIGIAWLLSNNKKKISWKIVGAGLLLQIFLALLVLGIPALGLKGPLKFLFVVANEGILKMLSFTEEGSGFLLGDLINPEKSGFIIVFQVLPIIIFLSSLMTLLYHVGLMQIIVNAFARVMQKTLNLSGAESLAAAANVLLDKLKPRS